MRDKRDDSLMHTYSQNNEMYIQTPYSGVQGHYMYILKIIIPPPEGAYGNTRNLIICT